MPLVSPFCALRPAPGRAAEVLAPPYDVLSSEEARERARGHPWSFLHVSKPEIDLPKGTDPTHASVYAKAAENLKAMIDAGVLQRDRRPGYSVYRLTSGSHSQTGLAVAASVAEYDRGRILRHELTTPVKEDDRVRQIEAVNAQTGPVMMAYPDAPELDCLIAAATACAPDADAVARDGIRHQIWVIAEPAGVAAITAACERLAALYITDGHHRSAAASRVSAARGGDAGASHRSFLAVVFPARELRILDYNRVVRDLNGLTPQAFLTQLTIAFRVTAEAAPVHPRSSGEAGLYLSGAWHRLAINPSLVPAADPIGRLDVSLLAAHVLEPILGIADQRRDKRIDFVGGARGLEGLMARVDSGEMAAAFALFPTSMADLMRVADAGQIMPPKSTWFEPKLADGLVSHVLD